MPKVVDHEAYRCELIRTSFEVVAKVGFASLSMKALAQSLNISTGLIYHYFASKEDWFVSLVRHFSKEVYEMLTREIPSDAPLEAKCDLLVGHIDRHKEFYANLIGVASDYVRLPNTERQQGALELGFAADQLYEYVAALFEADEPTARAILSLLIGVVVANRLDPRGVDVKEHLPHIRMLVACDTSSNGAASR